MNDTTIPDESIQDAANTLKKLQPGFLPLPIFYEIARLTTTPIIEIVPLRHKAGAVQVLLLQREHDDPVWPDKLHIPGTVIRATDTIESALTRILTKELGGLTHAKPVFVQDVFHHSGRGMEFAQIYWIDVPDDLTVGQFFDANDLPAALIQSQLDFIPLAVSDYMRQL